MYFIDVCNTMKNAFPQNEKSADDEGEHSALLEKKV